MSLAKVIQALVDVLPSGSYVAASQLAVEHDLAGVATMVEAYREGGWL